MMCGRTQRGNKPAAVRDDDDDDEAEEKEHEAMGVCYRGLLLVEDDEYHEQNSFFALLECKIA